MSRRYRCAGVLVICCAAAQAQVDCQLAELANNPVRHGQWGQAVAVLGSTIAVTVPGQVGVPSWGAAYVFRRSAGTWPAAWISVRR